LIVLYGGNRPKDLNDSTDNFSTWKLEKKGWVSMNVYSPYYFNAAMSYDVNSDYVLRFGGWNGKERLSETWIFKNEWQLINTSKAPSARNHSKLVYDKINQQHVLFGGHNGDFVFGDTWVFKNMEWSELIPASPLKRAENDH
jgi:hypothetical protein